MGNTWEIEVWNQQPEGHWGYSDFWCGESCFAAVWNFIRAKRAGYGCVTLHWR
jgi:hypothetical protein